MSSYIPSNKNKYDHPYIHPGFTRVDVWMQNIFMIFAKLEYTS
ncbi:hypothetical protein CLOL250_02279 [Clostridium sp. L2-50]|nr:hypothetical protein CLOL250_02279 [Clostridium sp. L2-50]